jgi:hypothetical protein
MFVPATSASNDTPSDYMSKLVRLIKTLDEVLTEEERQEFLSLPCCTLPSTDEILGSMSAMLQNMGLHTVTTHAHRDRLKHMMRVVKKCDMYFREGFGVFPTAS